MVQALTTFAGAVVFVVVKFQDCAVNKGKTKIKREIFNFWQI